MAILDQVMQLKKEGKTDLEIMKDLQEEGFSTAQINDAINQAQIKNAINPMEQTEQRSIMASTPPTEVATAPEPQQNYQELQTPEPQEQEYYTPTTQTYDQNYQQDYSNQNYGTNPDTITEIAQQVVEEELKKHKKKTGDVVAFKNNIESEVEQLKSRITRMEKMLDKIQSSIIEKVGEFGENTNFIRKDLENLHNTTSKLMNPLIDNLHALEKKSRKK
jgi:DNA-binding transcriptional MerR regulator